MRDDDRHLPRRCDSARAAADKLKESGVGCVAITLGARGSMVFCGNKAIESVPPNAQSIPPAGGAYIGAMVAGYAHVAYRSPTHSSALATVNAMATTRWAPSNPSPRSPRSVTQDLSKRPVKCS